MGAVGAGSTGDRREARAFISQRSCSSSFANASTIQLAYEAYVSAITDFSDDSKDAFDRVAATSSISTLVAREANLFKLVQRSTKLAIFDLLLPGPKTSLRERLSGAGYSTSASAAVVELQVYSLEPNLDKIEALNTIPALLDDLLELYAPLQFPMRRTR